MWQARRRLASSGWNQACRAKVVRVNRPAAHLAQPGRRGPSAREVASGTSGSGHQAASPAVAQAAASASPRRPFLSPDLAGSVPVGPPAPSQTHGQPSPPPRHHATSAPSATLILAGKSPEPESLCYRRMVGTCAAGIPGAPGPRGEPPGPGGGPARGHGLITQYRQL